jgi:mycothiol synthase
MSVVIVSEQIRLRPVTIDDVEDVVALLNACAVAEIGAPEYSIEDVSSNWQRPGFNLETSARVAVTPDGKMVGFADVGDTAPIPVRAFVWARAHPDYLNQGIEDQLMDWAEERAKQVIHRAPEGARVVIHSESINIYEPGLRMLKNRGMTYVRSFYDMKIELENEPPQLHWPQGITVRVANYEQEKREILLARQEAFRDHWGFVEQPFEESLKQWQHFVENDVNFDPTLWFLAMDGDQIAGFSLCWPKTDHDPDMSWVGILGVLRPWRRKGLALALLQHSFGEFWRRGSHKVGLGVDASNLTGAMRLYTKAGMSPFRQFDLYEKELRPGVDWMRQSVEE